MSKLLSFILIIAMILVGVVVFITQRYQAIGTNSDDLIVFDKLNCSFIQKNEKGEWEEKSVKKGKILIDYASPEEGEKPAGVPSKTKPKPDLKI